jgi:hypothetical protein
MIQKWKDYFFDPSLDHPFQEWKGLCKKVEGVAEVIKPGMIEFPEVLVVKHQAGKSQLLHCSPKLLKLQRSQSNRKRQLCWAKINR